MKVLFSYLFAAQVLLSSLYVPLTIHTCHVSQQSDVYVYQSHDDCCSKRVQELGIQCCSLSEETIAFAGFAPVFQSFTFELELLAAPETLFAWKPLAEQTAAKNLIFDRSPPGKLFNRSLLTHMQVFRL